MSSAKPPTYNVPDSYVGFCNQAYSSTVRKFQLASSSLQESNASCHCFLKSGHVSYSFLILKGRKATETFGGITVGKMFLALT